MDWQPDVIVVGSGMGGSMAAYALAKAGVKVVMYEAGRSYSADETPMMNWDREAPLRAAGTPDKPFGYYDACIGAWDVTDEPYTVAEGSEFKWWRARMLGGRTNHWARHVPRFGPLDFKPYSRDGLGVDWPISYEDLEPYYDKAERLMGVIASNIELTNWPASRADTRQPPPAFRVPELLLKAACDSLDIPCIPAPRAVISRPIDGRDACFYASPCDRGCSIKANFQAVTVLIPPALATGNLRIVTDAMVAQVLTGSDGRARGIRYVDKKSGKWIEANARAVVLAASAGETARILLNSKAGGLANSSGQIGRNLTDTVGFGMAARLPSLNDRPRYNEDGVSWGHATIPWWGYEAQKAGQLDFPRGYHMETGGEWTKHPGMGVGNHALEYDGIGAPLRNYVRHTWSTRFDLVGRGEMIPNDDCYCELDPKVKDKWGIPVLRFHWKWSEHEIRQAEHMRTTIAAIFDRMGGKLLRPELMEGPVKISVGGEIIHEVGTARMGSRAKDSVVDGYGRAWDVPGLYLMDGSVLPSNPDKNPTLSIMALAWRSTDNLIARSKRGEL